MSAATVAGALTAAPVSTGAIVFAGTTIGSRVIVGDNACVRERCAVGDDVVIGRGSLVENDTTIGAMTKIQADAYVTAYSTLEEHVFIAPCVVTTNDNFMGRTERRHELIAGPTIRRGARVGGGAVLLPGVEIGGGPVIRGGDRTSTFDGGAERILQAARDRLPKTKPVQRFLMSGGSCEATVWNLYGYRATGVAIPLGNYHNQGPGNRVAPEIVSAKDLATAVDLIEQAGRHPEDGLARGMRLRRRVEGYLVRYGGRLRSSR